MVKYLLVILIGLSSSITSNAQVGIHRTDIFNDESVRRNVAAQTAADERRAREATEKVERDRRAMRQIEMDFAAERESELERLQKLPPDTPDLEPQLDYFRCMYPLSAKRPPSSSEVDSCIRQRRTERETKMRLAAIEQENIERQRRMAEEAERADEQRKADLALRLAAEAKEQAAREKAALQNRILWMAASLLGLIGVIATIYRRRAYGWRSVTLAAIFGGLSGLLIYFLGAMLVVKSGPPSQLFVAVTFFSGWIFSISLLLKGTTTVSKVIGRGFLLGAVEWFLLLPVGFFVTGRVVATAISNTGGSNAAAAGAAIGGGLLAFISGGVAIGMTVVCLIGYAVTYFFTREMKPETNENKKKCPECAEFIQLEARKCRYCGAELVPLAGPSA